jgi:multiple sugar transport system permease protein
MATVSKPHAGVRGVNRDRGAVILFLSPFLIGFFIFDALPMFSAVAMSFLDIHALSGLSDWSSISFAGLRNYAKFFGDPLAMSSFGRSFLYSLCYVPSLNIAAIVLALLIIKDFQFKGFVRTLIFTPYVTNIVAVAILWGLLLSPFDGIVNQILARFGVTQAPMWLYGQKTSIPTLAGIAVWKDVAFQMVVYMAAIQNVSADLYEAAEIEGASKTRQFFSITLPVISPTVFAMVVTSIINSFQNYALVRTLTNGGPGDASRVAVLNVYEQAFEYGNFSYASAQAIILFLIILAITVIQWRGQKKWVHY